MGKGARGMAVALMLATACGGASTHAGGEARRQVLVRIRDASIRPDPVRLAPGGTVGWVNDSTLYSAAIFFSDEEIGKLRCEELRPTFVPVAGGYRSEPLGSGAERTAFPCPLPPGEYEYRIEFFEGFTTGVPRRVENPYRTEAGRILVERGSPD